MQTNVTNKSLYLTMYLIVRDYTASVQVVYKLGITMHYNSIKGYTIT